MPVDSSPKHLFPPVWDCSHLPSSVSVHLTKTEKKYIASISGSTLHKNNVLMYPEWNSTTQNTAKVANPPTFVSQILSTDRSMHHFPTCLLIYFDHSAPLQPLGKAELSQQTGTPMCIVRAVCSGYLVNTASASQYKRMPELAGTAKTAYLNAYGMEPYIAFSDVDNPPSTEAQFLMRFPRMKFLQYIGWITMLNPYSGFSSQLSFERNLPIFQMILKGSGDSAILGECWECTRSKR
ncbi:hypothetical protein ABKN59_008699 [Abortiporus biennis]